MKDYIAVDWGSTQLRGWLIRNGQCVETKQLPMGITRLNGRSPADVFAEHLALARRTGAAGADGRDDRQRRGLASGAVSGLSDGDRRAWAAAMRRC